MFGSIIGAAGGIASSIFGGINAAKYMEKAEKEIANQRARNAAAYDAKRNENYVNSAEAQSLLAASRDAAMKQVASAEARAAVMGGNPQAVRDARDAANDLITNTAAGINQQSIARKDALEQQYRSTDAQLSDRLASMYQGQAAANQQAASQGMQMGAQAAPALDQMFNAFKKKPNTANG